jgi:hypothetical protein
MPGILAIEADPTRKRLLRALVREHVQAEITIADSVSAALAEIDRRLPDVILVPALVGPSDAEELMNRVQAHAAPYVQMLALPAFDILAAPAVAEQRRFLAVFRKRTPAPRPPYDRSMVGMQIADTVARAQQARAEYLELLAQRAESEELEKQWAAYESDVSMSLVPKDMVFDDAFATERRRAARLPQRDISWLSTVRLSGGAQLSVVNISRSGVLLASGSKFAPGSTTELHLTGPDTNLVVPVRFVRSEIARIDALGVMYHAAAAFGREIELGAAPARLAPARPLCEPRELAELLKTSLKMAQSSEPAHARFTRGLRELVGARDVHLSSLSAPSAPETLYFHVPVEDRARTSLRVIFERGRGVTQEELTLLRAAASMTAAALELEKIQAAADERAREEAQVA